MYDQAPNYENLRYLNPGKFFLLLSSKPGLYDFEKEQDIALLYLETWYFPKYFSSISSK
jgi:hypothetical protein